MLCLCEILGALMNDLQRAIDARQWESVRQIIETAELSDYVGELEDALIEASKDGHIDLVNIILKLPIKNLSLLLLNLMTIEGAIKEDILSQFGSRTDLNYQSIACEWQQHALSHYKKQATAL